MAACCYVLYYILSLCNGLSHLVLNLVRALDLGSFVNFLIPNLTTKNHFHVLKLDIAFFAIQKHKHLKYVDLD